MNCLEARQNFAAFWRRELDQECCAALIAHLGGCRKCDQAFRTFAFTAPVLHSKHAPNLHGAAPREFKRASDRRTAAPKPRAGRGAEVRLLAICASVLILFAASVGAYMAADAPHDSLSEALTNPQDPSIPELFRSGSPDLSFDLSG